ncbi:Hypothetical protein PSEBR_m1705 [Pseudomonas brassicacearum subsp. brassicacearum NFM421]|uniref:Uncharacterized protein n=1 Tax=Pseudomonas brassicacearum (strain NFM421) TaxID=994484 RepID=F2K6N1_PSEBN|nr:Hypothetical protein PSEBR_m1705 [Pseudomonas brassicacearum subsp. brassicacearum NFM421]
MWRGNFRFAGARLARETGNLVSERPHRSHRGQALIPQGYRPDDISIRYLACALDVVKVYANIIGRSGIQLALISMCASIMTARDRTL